MSDPNRWVWCISCGRTHRAGEPGHESLAERAELCQRVTMRAGYWYTATFYEDGRETGREVRGPFASELERDNHAANSLGAPRFPNWRQYTPGILTDRDPGDENP